MGPVVSYLEFYLSKSSVDYSYYLYNLCKNNMKMCQVLVCKSYANLHASGEPNQVGTETKASTLASREANRG